ncbi:MAG: hypothetical protein GWP14_03725 [Actinobacteria bacterium]|nr:hypothetical protein [Actinomycetota bacterium]
MKTSLLHRYGQWWPILLGFAAMGLVYVAAGFGRQELFSKSLNERLAPILLAISIAGFLLQAVVFRSQFHLLMAIVCAGLFCREWHFSGSSVIMYITLALFMFWAFRRKELFGRVFAKTTLKIWMIATLATYVLSQLIARRLFRHLHLPQEMQLHIHLEETVENTAHIMMIVVCILAWRVGSSMVKSTDSQPLP